MKLQKENNNPIYIGFMGAIFLLLSSWFLGTIPKVIHIKNPNWIFYVNNNLYITLLFVVLGVLGATLHIIAWIKLYIFINKNSDNNKERPLYIIKRAILMWKIPLLFSFPMFSNDIFAYFMQGKLLLYGLDPYINSMSSIANWRDQGVSEIWIDSPTPYGPLFLFIAKLIVIISNNNLLFGVLGFRVLAILGTVLCYHFILKITIFNRIDPNKAIWLTIINPLFSFAFIISAHNDALMMGFLLSGVYYTLKNRIFIGLLLVSCSLAIKPITLLCIPFIGLIWLHNHKNYINYKRLKIKIWICTLFISLLPVIIFGSMCGLTLGWLNAFNTPSQVFSFYAPVSYIVWISSFLDLELGGNGQLGPAIVKNFFIVITVSSILRLIFLEGDKKYILKNCTLAFAITVTFSPVIYGWYILWIIILFSISFGFNNRYVVYLVYLSVFYSLAPFAEPMDVSIIVDNAGLARILSILSIIIACYFLFFKEKSIKIFTSKHKAIYMKKSKKSCPSSLLS